MLKDKSEIELCHRNVIFRPYNFLIYNNFHSTLFFFFFEEKKKQLFHEFGDIILLR